MELFVIALGGWILYHMIRQKAHFRDATERINHRIQWAQEEARAAREARLTRIRENARARREGQMEAERNR